MFSIGVLLSCGKEKVEFEDLVAVIDGELALGALEQADQNILLAASVAAGRSEWLSLLKRAYILGTALNTYETLYITSKDALSEISGAEEIAALCAFSCLRTGKYEMAFQYAEEYLLSDKWNSIRSEAVLRRHALSKGVFTPASGENPLLDAVFSEDPIALARAALLFNESRFALAAALRFAAEGEIDTATDTIIPYTPEYPEVGFLLSYDAGRYKRAAEISFSTVLSESLRSDALDLIKGDIYLRLKDTGSALKLYKEIIAAAPDISWIPYVNSALILTEQGQFEKAAEMMATGKGFFPEQKQLLLSEILIFSGRDEEIAVNLIEKYKGLYPADPEIAVITAGVFPSEANRIRLESALWNAFLQNQENTRTARYLAASLLASGDNEGLSMLLDVWERENGNTAWSLFLRGYQGLMNRFGAEASEAFERSYLLSPRWETAFNLGVIARRAGDYDRSIDHFRDSENLIPEKWTMITQTRASIRAAIARVLYERGDFESSLREARYALDLDPGSNEASLLIDLLEQEPN